MIEKMNIFDVEIPILTAKEAMIRAMQYLESESVDTIELVSMDMLMKERENAQWKEQINELTMLLPENTEILKAAEIENEKLFRETEENVFLKMFMNAASRSPLVNFFCSCIHWYRMPPGRWFSVVWQLLHTVAIYCGLSEAPWLLYST